MPKSNEFTPMYDDLPTHRKTRAFRAMTGWDLTRTMGFFYLFWRQVGKDSPYGKLSGLATVDSILDALGYKKDEIAKIADALLKSELIEDDGQGGMQVHDWQDGAGKFTIKKEKDRIRKREEREKKRLEDESDKRPRTNYGLSVDSPSDVHGQSTDVHPKEKKGKEKKETHIGECASNVDLFDASLSPTYQEVLSVYADVSGIRSKDPNTKQGARELAFAIDSGDLDKAFLRDVIKAGLNDEKLPNQGLRGIARNYNRYLPKASSTPKRQEMRVVAWKCETCGQVDRQYWSLAEDPLPKRCSADGCSGRMEYIHPDPVAV